MRPNSDSLDPLRQAHHALPGFRLARLEVSNWGPFGHHVWAMPLDGGNILLTGDAGSGTTALADAVITLLTPGDHIPGDALSGTRQHGNSHAVILGVFRNVDDNQTVLLAQVFLPTAGPPQRYFICAARDLTITHDIAPTGADVAAWRTAIVNTGAAWFDDRSHYEAWCRQHLGIDDGHALTLCRHLASMSGTDDLTEFLRHHVLPPEDTPARLAALLGHFDDLDSAHEAILHARRQEAMLAPLVAECERHAELSATIDDLRTCREALHGYFAELKRELLNEWLAALDDERDRQERHVNWHQVRCDALHAEALALRQRLSDQGGDHIAQLELAIQQKERMREQRKQRAATYRRLVERLRIPAAETEADFRSQQDRLATWQPKAAEREAALRNAHNELTLQLRLEAPAAPIDDPARTSALQGKIAQIDAALATLRDQQIAAAQIAMIGDFTEVDWRSAAVEVARLDEEKVRQSNPDALRPLADELDALQATIREAEQHLQDAREARIALQAKHDIVMAWHQDTEAVLAESLPAMQTVSPERLDVIRAEALGEHKLTLECVDHRQQDVRTWLQAHIDAEAGRLDRFTEHVLRILCAFKAAFPVETAQMEASPAARSGYQNLLETLRTSELPRLTARFDDLLSLNMVYEIAYFHGHLGKAFEAVRGRVAQINAVLARIDSTSGQYAQIDLEADLDADIRDFEQELHLCTEATPDIERAEERFARIERLLNRLRDGPQQSDADRLWASKVTDVRNWFHIGVSERWRAEDPTHTHYVDADDPAGTHRARLAYSILAAGLADALAWGEDETRSRALRFVVLGDRFGQGPDTLIRPVLQRFAGLQVQLLIAAPLQKVPVMEPFVSTVAYVRKTDDGTSAVHSLPIDAYRAVKGRGRGSSG
ncbi:ATP-binding protein [Cupriavidus sp. RAF12]|uniref:ATP-binding protein n=1 Tax=Cupriavidus sp. RAF12 TaxID=3233050 RepID=UPI003F905F46